MRKLANWEELWADFIKENKNKPFVWGSWDCVHFSDSLIKKITGESVVPWNILKWADKDSAKKAIYDYNKTLGNAIAKACKRLDIKEIQPRYATKADLVTYLNEGVEVCGMHDGFAVLGPNEQGINVNNDVDILRAWRLDG